MPFMMTTAIRKIAAMRCRVRIIQGGSSAGKTIGVEACLIDTAQSGRKMVSVVSETFPHLKKGAIRDFRNIMQDHGYWNEREWNATDSVCSFPTGSQIEFFSGDSADKVRGPRRDILFLNEANNVSYETYTQLAIRTNDHIFIDYNPVAEFWVHEHYLNNPAMVEGVDYDFAVLTYLDNEGLPESIVREIEGRRGNRYFWQVYGLGLVGEVEGKIYNGWRRVPGVPHEARLERRWLDYGYTNDPTAIGEIWYHDGGYVLNEVAYTKGLSNRQIADILLNLEHPEVMVKADSAEPKSNDELMSYGVNVVPALKGKDSVNAGIQFVQEKAISYTERSVNIEKEYRNYMWDTDRDGRPTRNPSPIWNHHMDGMRYGFEGLNGPATAPSIVGYEEGMGGAMIPVYDF